MDAYAALIIPWLLTSGIKIVFLIIGSLILNKVYDLINCCKSLMEFLLKMPKKKRNTLIKFYH
jgi:hypothetical protein